MKVLSGVGKKSFRFQGKFMKGVGTLYMLSLDNRHAITRHASFILISDFDGLFTSLYIDCIDFVHNMHFIADGSQAEWD